MPVTSQSTTTTTGSHCNAYAEPGFVASNNYPVWKTFDPVCEAPAMLCELLGAVPSAANSPAAPMRAPLVSPVARAEISRVMANRSILLVGDAVDRSMVQSLCVMLGLQSQSVTAQHPWGYALNQVPAASFEGGVRRDPGDTILADYCYEPTVECVSADQSVCHLVLPLWYRHRRHVAQPGVVLPAVQV